MLKDRAGGCSGRCRGSSPAVKPGHRRAMPATATGQAPATAPGCATSGVAGMVDRPASSGDPSAGLVCDARLSPPHIRSDTGCGGGSRASRSSCGEWWGWRGEPDEGWGQLRASFSNGGLKRDLMSGMQVRAAGRGRPWCSGTIWARDQAASSENRGELFSTQEAQGYISNPRPRSCPRSISGGGGVSSGTWRACSVIGPRPRPGSTPSSRRACNASSAACFQSAWR
jgi:hypothetical protein